MCSPICLLSICLLLPGAGRREGMTCSIDPRRALNLGHYEAYCLGGFLGSATIDVSCCCIISVLLYLFHVSPYLLFHISDYIHSNVSSILVVWLSSLCVSLASPKWTHCSGSGPQSGSCCPGGGLCWPQGHGQKPGAQPSSDAS